MRRSELLNAALGTLLLSINACHGSSSPPSAAKNEAHATTAEAAQDITATTSDSSGDHHSMHDHAHHMLQAAAPFATDSLYQTHVRLTDQDGRALDFASLRGSVVLATMFYASCTSVCPMLIAQLAHLVEKLPNEARAQTQVLLVSLDPARDNHDALKQLAQRHGISDPSWHFARTDTNNVREMAALLGVRYRQLPNGDFSHSPIIALLDRAGVIVGRMENAADDPAQLIAALNKALQTDTTTGAL